MHSDFEGRWKHGRVDNERTFYLHVRPIFSLFFLFFFLPFLLNRACVDRSSFLFFLLFFFFFTIFHNGNRNRLNRMALFFLFAFSKCTIMLSWFIEPCEKNTISVRKSVIKQFLPLVHPFVHSISWKNRSPLNYYRNCKINNLFCLVDPGSF